MKKDKRVALLYRSLITGFIGGLIWSMLGVIMYYFSFSEIAPKAIVLRSWLKTEWTDKWQGDIVSVFIIGLFSILVAIIYYGLFKKVNSLWIGATYGLVLWIIFFYIIQPLIPNIQHVADFNNTTIISTICLFILYGSFIGYSISYDYYDTRFLENHPPVE